MYTDRSSPDKLFEPERNYWCCSQGCTHRVLLAPERVFHPGLANLFEPLGVICATAHAIKILRNDRMICFWQCVNQLTGWSPLLHEVVADRQTDL